MKPLESMTLEMSLKPFKQMDAGYVEAVCRRMFTQWQPLLQHTALVKVLLWIADGSEILDYDRDMDREVEWARYIGGATPRQTWDKANDPDGVGLHTRSYLYMDNPPVLTYRILRNIVMTIKRIGTEMLNKPVEVGATFDPGPEFARSSFKYERHPEICRGDTMGTASFVSCYAILHADQRSYAGYLNGIPEGTPFGTFLGRQCHLFLTELDFDYLWLSNGFGFGTEAWGTTGTIFDGESFHTARMQETQQELIAFWQLFREACPHHRVETRGTNLSAGIDLSTDGVPLRDIYEGGFGIMPPPNSPWAALNGDFGLELIGYMSRIAELPDDETYLYRFYTHDPWWMNSPWLDRYEGQPHDIYLPLAISRLNRKGEIVHPQHLNLLTIDNCLGELPEQVPNEVIPHLQRAYVNQPDAAAPFVWIYPFREYHEAAASGDDAVGRPFFEDWFMRGAINHGLPLGTVVSSDIFVETIVSDAALYHGSIMISPVPTAGSSWEKELLAWVASGRQAILYGAVRQAGEALLAALNLEITSAIDGELDLHLSIAGDTLRHGKWPARIQHRAVFSDGGIDTVTAHAEDAYTQVVASVSQADEGRTAALLRRHPDWQGGALGWVRGTNGNRHEDGQHLLIPDDPCRYFPSEALLRLIAEELGTQIQFEKESPDAANPVVMMHRSKGAFIFSGYMPDTTVDIRLRLPMGAPLLLGWETRLDHGRSVYRMPRAWQAECRVFVDQTESQLLRCREIPSVSIDMRRRINVSGLVQASVTIFPESGYAERTNLMLNSIYPYVVGEALEWEDVETPWGRAIVLKNVSGELIISTPF